MIKLFHVEHAWKDREPCEIAISPEQNRLSYPMTLQSPISGDNTVSLGPAMWTFLPKPGKSA
jgi:hypothetical protein